MKKKITAHNYAKNSDSQNFLAGILKAVESRSRK